MGATLKLTSPDRIVYADAGLTKADVAAYYRDVSAWLLPGLVDRPLSLLRCPQGTAAACFFQKHPSDALGAHVHSIELPETDGHGEYLYVKDVLGLMELVQMNTLEFHPWGATVEHPEQPDRLVFDLDPDEGLAWAKVKAAAREIRDALEARALRSWVRLSGGKGLHVVVPIQRGPDWGDAKAFCEHFADAMVHNAPDRFIARAGKAERRGRIFIDWLRNTRGATSVCNWSLRARKGAPVVMPLRWDELARTRTPGQFDLRSALRRLARLGDDPWHEFASTKQRLPRG